MTRIAFRFEDVTVPAEIDSPPDVFSALASFGLAFAPGGGADAPLISVTPDKGDFHISGEAYVSPFHVKGEDAVAGSIAAGLVRCKGLATGDDTLCIHGAAARLGERTFVFLAPFGAGKSSLIACLAQRGATILTDDAFLLNVPRMTVRGMGLPVRLRQSFIRAASPELRNWIAPRVIFSGQRFAYLFPDEWTGDAQPLTDIVLLNRSGDATAGEPYLEAVSPGQLLPRIVWHNLSRHHPPTLISSLALGAAGQVRASVLHFTDVDRAAEALHGGGMTFHAATGQIPPEAEMWDRFQITRIPQGAVVSCDETGSIIEVNETAFVIIKLLQAFPDDAEAWQALRTIYDDVPCHELAGHFLSSLRQLAENGVIGMGRLAGLQRIVETSPSRMADAGGTD